MSPVFRHGRLRLYLLKLLDESPRHGYEVIRLLQDRFLGVYAPSPGTIYPRLARLEEEGLVTHEEVDGKKIYSITDKGREEIRNRLTDLADLEDELTESLRDVAREISEDVRDTVRSIREELAAAARAVRNQHAAGAGDQGGARSGADSAGAAAGEGPGADRAARAGNRSDRKGRSDRGGRSDGSDEAAFAGDEARRIKEEGRRTREEMRAKFRARSRNRDWSDWQERARSGDWGGWSSAWSAWSDEADQPGGGAGRPGRGGASPFSDLERMAIQFATELRAAAKQAGDVGERSLADVRDILADTLAKVRVEVFTEGSRRAGKTPGDPGGEGEQPGGPGTTPPGSTA